jgi:uncharacterized protein YjiS (DUF1127 family)
MNKGSITVLNSMLWQLWLSLYTVMAPARHQGGKRLPFKYCWQRYKTRQQLRYLTPQQLEDVGMTAQQAEKEMNMPFWR